MDFLETVALNKLGLEVTEMDLNHSQLIWFRGFLTKFLKYLFLSFIEVMDLEIILSAKKNTSVRRYVQILLSISFRFIIYYFIGNALENVLKFFIPLSLMFLPRKQ